jgi:hypothetical protein
MSTRDSRGTVMLEMMFGRASLRISFVEHPLLRTDASIRKREVLWDELRKEGK